MILRKMKYYGQLYFALFLALGLIGEVMAEDCLHIPTKHVIIDGQVDDWVDIEPVLIDNANDVYGDAFVDFTKVYLAHDDIYLYIRFEFDQELNPSNFSNLDLHVSFDQCGSEPFFAAAHFYPNPDQGFVVLVSMINEQTFMNYPANFTRYLGRNVEYKVALSDIPCSLQDVSEIRAWVHGVDNQRESIQDDSHVVKIGCLSSEFNGWWYDKTAPGTGISAEFTNQHHWFLTWYTYDRTGLPTWYSASGQMSDATNFTGDLIKWVGWPWGQSYEPPNFEKVGTVYGVLSNGPNKKITLNWSLDDIGSGVLNLTNFMKDVASGMPDTRGLTGWWYDPSYNGMGFFIEVYGNTLFLAWYNYGEDGRPRWYTSAGSFPDGSSVYNGTLSMWRNGQIPGGPYKQPEELKEQKKISLTFTNSSRAILVLDELNVLNLERFRF